MSSPIREFNVSEAFIAQRKKVLTVVSAIWLGGFGVLVCLWGNVITPGKAEWDVVALFGVIFLVIPACVGALMTRFIFRTLRDARVRVYEDRLVKLTAGGKESAAWGDVAQVKVHTRKTGEVSLLEIKLTGGRMMQFAGLEGLGALADLLREHVPESKQVPVSWVVRPLTRWTAVGAIAGVAVVAGLTWGLRTRVSGFSDVYGPLVFGAFMLVCGLWQLRIASRGDLQYKRLNTIIGWVFVAAALCLLATPVAQLFGK